MKPKQRQQLVAMHRASFNTFGYKPDTLFWRSRGIQKARFRALAEVGIQQGDSLLDVGCGFADFASWLKGAGIPVEYTGIDLSPEILMQASRVNPGLDLRCGDLFDFSLEGQSFDWITLSGTLNWNLHDDEKYAYRLIARMFELCSKGVAFNMLDAGSFDDAAVLGDMKGYRPDSVLEYCRTITPDCQYRSDYLPDDFTIYMMRR